jgi:phosphate transport system substrate-binding protein
MRALINKRVFCSATSARRIAIVGAALVLAACSANKEPVSTVPAGKVVIKGSNTIGEELAPKLIADYKKDHPGLDFELESKATGYGLAALMAGQCNIAGASRPPIDDELEQAKTRNMQLNDHPIGYYSIAVVVNAANPVANLTREQVRDIFTGTVHNWKDLGGADAPIHLLIRDPISGTYLGFREVAMENKSYGTNRTTFTNYTQIVEHVAQDPNAIGYCGLNLAKHAGVKAESIQGIEPTAATINDGKYPFSRLLRFYTEKASEGGPALDFIRFVESAKGQEILSEMGYVPRTAEKAKL